VETIFREGKYLADMTRANTSRKELIFGDISLWESLLIFECNLTNIK